MSGTTTKGFPYNVGSDGPSTIDDRMQALAQYMDDLLNSVTTAQRDALPAALKWHGRVIFNTTTKRHEWWDANATKWRPLITSRGSALIFSVL